MITWPSPESIEASEHQRTQYAAIARSTSRLAILNGGPGTGKTYSTAAIVKAIRANGSVNVGLAAPTGKAAIRLTQLMKEHGIDGEAKTVHRLLGVSRNGYDGDGWGFFHNASNPLPHHVICVDEVSMLSTDLAASLFAAIRPDSLVLLIGDTGQLLPVGHGAPMRDLLTAGVPSATLTEIRRTSGDMAHACRAMAERGEFRPSVGRNLDAGQNWWHLDSRSPARTREILAGLLKSLPGTLTTNDVQVLCTVNRKSKLSREALNELLAPICNPGRDRRSPKCWFAKGDKVMCTENGAYRVAGGDAEDKHFVANGEIGYVQSAMPGRCTIRFEAPERVVELAGDQLKSLTLAYAITVHKSQGSQWPVVIYPIDDHKSARFVASRELIYTAVSRQQRLTVTIGIASVARQACSKVRIGDRKTFLVEDIKQ